MIAVQSKSRHATDEFAAEHEFGQPLPVAAPEGAMQTSRVYVSVAK